MLGPYLNYSSISCNVEDFSKKALFELTWLYDQNLPISMIYTLIGLSSQI